MSLLGLNCHELLDRFADSHPTPGGGSGAALAGAMGAALVSMVCAMPKTRQNSEEERARLQTALGWTRESSLRLRQLIDDDAAAYDAVVAAFRMAKITDEEKSSRSFAIKKAMEHATQVPLDTARACLVVLKAAEEAALYGNPKALSDARTGGAMAWAGLIGAVENVRININMDSEAGTRTSLLEETEALIREGRYRAQALGLPL